MFQLVKIYIVEQGSIFLKKLFKNARLGALSKLCGVEFQNKAPLYLNEFLPTPRLKRGTSNLMLLRRSYQQLLLLKSLIMLAGSS